MQIAIAQLNYHIGNITQNTAKIIQTIQRAKQDKVDLVVFAEMSVCGYLPMDLLEFDDFIDASIHAVHTIAPYCTDIAAIVGAPSRNTENTGKKLFNSAYFLENGTIKQVYNKGLLPNYDVFDEYRYFEPATTFLPIQYKDKIIALTICEDIWDIQPQPMYDLDPLTQLATHNPDFIINISASPYAATHAWDRKNILNHQTTKHNVPIVYVNYLGTATEVLFEGSSIIVNKEGNIVLELDVWKEDYRIIDINTIQQAKNTTWNADFYKELAIQSKPKNNYDALVFGVQEYFRKMNFKKAILGLSGGIDSAVTAVIAVKALGAENVLAVLMPSSYSSEHSLQDALQLAKNINCSHKIIPIKDMYQSFSDNLLPHFEGIPFNVTEENLQARIRGTTLMALSNKLGYILLNTTNKSEAAVGYGTLYGDLCGGLAVLADVYKTEIYDLVHYINKDTEIIPQTIISKPPSAELRPNQKDSDSLPEYAVLDKIIYEFVERKQSLKQIISSQSIDNEIVNFVLKLIKNSEYKRYQTAPAIRISSKAFGIGRRMPLDALYDGVTTNYEK